MKEFKEYYEEKELEEINESLLTIAAIVGFTAAAPFILWAASVIVSTYVKGMRKVIQGIRKALNIIFKGKPAHPKEVQQTLSKMRKDTDVRRAEKMFENQTRKYEDDLKDLYSAIDQQDADLAKEEYKKLDPRLRNDKKIKLAIIKSISESLGQPPLHFGERGKTGNETYMFIKKVIDLKTAQAAAVAMREALKKFGPDLLENPNGEKADVATDEEE